MDGGTTGRRPHRFTVTDYHRMAQAGILDEDSRVELIRGQIVDMAPVGAPHIAMVNRLTRLMAPPLAGRGILSVQNPVRLDDGSEPEPDIAILKPRSDDYETATPCAEDVLLVIEVADSSLADDRAVKVPLYAESGIPECWVVDVPHRAVEIYRQPEQGRYVQTWRVGAEGVLEIAELPGLSFRAENLLRLGT